ncbi:MAG: hypothetical protein H7A06_05455 [Pseudomonadales bacterium]|nr:hypothetical protein [Pseudomonadales bacterium]
MEKRSGRYEVNSLASILSRSSAGHIKSWIEDGLLAYRHKQKSRSWLQSVTLQLRWEGVKNGSRRQSIAGQRCCQSGPARVQPTRFNSPNFVYHYA